MAKRSQINIRSTAVIDAVLHSLTEKLDKSKTEIVHAALMQLANQELSKDELLVCLQQDYK